MPPDYNENILGAIEETFGALRERIKDIASLIGFSAIEEDV